MADFPMTIAVSGFIDTLRGGTTLSSFASIGVGSTSFFTAEIAVVVVVGTGAAAAGDSLAAASVEITAACGNSAFGNAGTVVDGGDGAPFCAVLLTIGVAMAFDGADDGSVPFGWTGAHLPKMTGNYD